MKKKYSEPELELIPFPAEDVIVTSNGLDYHDDTQGEYGDVTWNQ